MKNFDIKRFGRLVKWSLVCGWKGWMKFYVIWSLVWFFVFAIQTWTRQGLTVNGVADYDMADMGGPFILGFFIVLFSAAPSAMFAGLKTKQQRIGYFSLPATNLEKFIASFVVVNVGCIAVTILGGWTADILRFIFRALIGDYNSRMVMVEVIKSFFNFSHDVIYVNGNISASTIHWIVFTVAMGCAYCYSLYLLGGSIFRKTQWLLTSIAIVILLMTVITFLNRFIVVEGEEQAVAFFRILCAIFAVLSVFNVWASYRMFTRMQVINNKWMNL